MELEVLELLDEADLPSALISDLFPESVAPEAAGAFVSLVVSDLDASGEVAVPGEVAAGDAEAPEEVGTVPTVISADAPAPGSGAPPC